MTSAANHRDCPLCHDMAPCEDRIPDHLRHRCRVVVSWRKSLGLGARGYDEAPRPDDVSMPARDDEGNFAAAAGGAADD